MKSQLLCTFCTKDTLSETVDKILNTYTLVFNNIYVLVNIEDENQYILTYNVDSTENIRGTPPESTISVHRKKQSNTIYTINALNRLIQSKNDGVLDKSYKVYWNELKNTVMVTAQGELKLIKTKIQQILNFGT